MMLSAHSRLSRAPDVVAQVVANEAILIHMASGVYYSLNAVGTDFWNALDGRRTIAEHATALASEYAVESARVEGDLLELARNLAQENLIAVENE